MRILLLNEYFPPDTAATAYMAAGVVDELAKEHTVTVLCGRPSYDPSERHPFYVLRRETHGHVTVERVGSTTFPRFRMLKRLSNFDDLPTRFLRAEIDGCADCDRTHIPRFFNRTE